MKVLRFFAIVLSFIVEVRVKAGNLQQEPHQCLSSSQQVCSIYSKGTSSLKTSKFEILMHDKSIFYRNSKREWNFVSGVVRISTKTPLRLKSALGLIKLGAGIFWLQWSNEKLWALSLKGTINIDLLSTDLKQNTLNKGFANWYGLVSFKSKNIAGVPRAITNTLVSEVFPQMEQHSDWTLVEKQKSRSIAQSSDFYQEIVQKVYHDQEQEEQKRESQIQNQIRIEKSADKLFRDKHLSPIDLGNSLTDQEN